MPFVRYLVSFIILFVAQYIFFTFIQSDTFVNLLDIFSVSILFVIITFIIDKVSKKKINRLRMLNKNP